jgi:hypothetical protein
MVKRAFMTINSSIREISTLIANAKAIRIQAHIVGFVETAVKDFKSDSDDNLTSLLKAYFENRNSNQVGDYLENVLFEIHEWVNGDTDFICDIECSEYDDRDRTMVFATEIVELILDVIGERKNIELMKLAIRDEIRRLHV